MTTCYFETLAAFAVSCLLSAMIIPKISLIAFRRRLFDPLDDRKLHTTHIPRLGGIAFFPCIIMPISLVIACHNLCTDSNLLSWEQSTCLLTLFSCLFMLYLMGMRDDLIGMRYRAKFIIQTLCGLLLVASGFCFDNLYGLFGIYELPYYVGIPFTVFIIVYIMNAINLIDGIDGLASGLREERYAVKETGFRIEHDSILRFRLHVRLSTLVVVCLYLLCSFGGTDTILLL